MPPKYQRVVIKGVNDRIPTRSEQEEELAEEIEHDRFEKLQFRLRQPRRRRTTRYSRADWKFFDRVEQLTKLTKAQLIEHIIRLEASLESLQ